MTDERGTSADYYVDSSNISYIASIDRGTNNCVFCSSRIRTLVAMATFSSHRLIIGKDEIDNFFCLIGDIWNFLVQKCLLSRPLRFI